MLVAILLTLGVDCMVVREWTLIAPNSAHVFGVMV